MPINSVAVRFSLPHLWYAAFQVRWKVGQAVEVATVALLAASRFLELVIPVFVVATASEKMLVPAPTPDSYKSRTRRLGVRMQRTVRVKTKITLASVLRRGTSVVIMLIIPAAVVASRVLRTDEVLIRPDHEKNVLGKVGVLADVIPLSITRQRGWVWWPLS